MATIVPQMAKLSVKDLLETRERLEADISLLLRAFEERTGISPKSLRLIDGYLGFHYVTDNPETAIKRRVSVELSL